MKQFEKTSSITNFYPKLQKLRYLLQNSDIKIIRNSANSRDLPLQIPEIIKKNMSPLNSKVKNADISKDFSLYFSIIENPLNLLFSVDQFLFEFSKKTYQQKKTGEFFQQLKERKKLSLFYGHLTKKQLLNFFNKVKKTKGYFYKNIFSLLESRLDVVLYRSGLTKTVTEARQLIKHRKIKVNQKFVTIPSFLLNPGDILSIDSLSNQLLNSMEIGSLKQNEKMNYAKSFSNPKLLESKNRPDFYSKFQKHLEFSLSHRLKNKEKFAENLMKSDRKSISKTSSVSPSRLFCKLFIEFLCTLIKFRSYWNLNTDQMYSNQRNLRSDKCSLILNKPFFTLFKWKSFSKNSTRSLKANSWNFLSKRQNIKQQTFYVNDIEFLEFGSGCLQKKPLIWNHNLLNLKRRQNNYSRLLKNRTNGFDFLNKSKSNPQDTNDYFKKSKPIQNKKVGSLLSHSFLNSDFNSKNFRKTVRNFKKNNNLMYRKSFLMFLNHLDNYKKFTNLIHLNFKKFLFKKSIYKTKYLISKYLNFRIIRPLNIEVSYSLLNVVYLYSPQRVNFPFYIDLDLIKRSLR